MAEASDPKNNDGVEQKRPKRRLRAAPETVRERTARLEGKQEAAQNGSAKSGAGHALASGFLWAPRKLGGALARFGRFLGKYKFFRVLGKIIVPPYFRNSWRELRQVTWPGRKQSWKLTYAVIVFSVIFGVIVFIVDFGLDKLFKEILVK